MRPPRGLSPSAHAGPGIGPREAWALLPIPAAPEEAAQSIGSGRSGPRGKASSSARRSSGPSSSSPAAAFSST